MLPLPKPRPIKVSFFAWSLALVLLTVGQSLAAIAAPSKTWQGLAMSTAATVYPQFKSQAGTIHWVKDQMPLKVYVSHGLTLDSVMDPKLGRPPRVTSPESPPWRTATRSGFHLPFAPAISVTSVSIRAPSTWSPAPTARASNPSSSSPASSPTVMLTASGNSKAVSLAPFAGAGLDFLGVSSAGPSAALRCLVVLLHDGPLLDRMFLTDTRHLPDGRRQAGDRHLKLPRRTGQPPSRMLADLCTL